MCICADLLLAAQPISDLFHVSLDADVALSQVFCGSCVETCL